MNNPLCTQEGMGSAPYGAQTESPFSPNWREKLDTELNGLSNTALCRPLAFITPRRRVSKTFQGAHQGLVLENVSRFSVSIGTLPSN